MNANRLVITADVVMPCGWRAYNEAGVKITCQGGKDAVHILTETLPIAPKGTALCGYHSPYDVTDADRAALTQSAEKSTEVLPARLVTLCGTFAMGETVTHVEHGQGVIVDLGSAGGILVQFDGGATLGVGEDSFSEWGQVRTDDLGTLPTDEAMAEAERDDAAEMFTAQRRAIVEADNDDSASTNERDGIEILRDLLTLPNVKTIKATKVAVMHLDDAGISTWACGTKVGTGQGTTDPANATCKRCPKTVRFARFVERANRARRAAEYARAGLFASLVVRQITTGRLGVVTGLDSQITVGFWAGQITRHSFGDVAGFDRAMQIVKVDDLVSVGSVIVSNIGDEATVTAVGSLGVAFIRADSTTGSYTASELAAEISRGSVAVVPTGRRQAAPTAVYIRPDGIRQAVTMADMAEVGMRVSFGYGSANNGDVTAVTAHAATVKRADGSHYLLTLTELTRELNRSNVSTFIPDANGRAIGSWR